MQKINFFVWILVLISLTTGCVPNKKSQPDNTSLEAYRMPTDIPLQSSLTETEQTEIALSTPPTDCPVTTSEFFSFEAPEPYPAFAPWPDIFWFGSKHLWTALSKNGIWSDLPHNQDGYTQKIPWWSSLFSVKDEPEPDLLVFGERLDAESPPLKASRATNAFAKDFGSSMLVGVDFPTEGCWKITGQYKKTSLTFIVKVIP